MFRATVGAALLLIGAIGAANADELPPVVDYQPYQPAAAVTRPFPPDVVPALPNPTPMPAPKQPSGPANDVLNDRFSTPFTTQTGAGGYQGKTFNTEFDGDFGGIFFKQKVQVGLTTQKVQIGTTTTQVQTGTKTTVRIVTDPMQEQPTRIVTVTPVFKTVTTPVFQDVQVPVYRDVTTVIAGRYSGVMITDNDSPRPVDRAYFGYSYYDGLGADMNPGFGDVSQNRQLFGFEKTQFDGNTSLGIRLPYVAVNGPPGVGSSSIGDLSLLSKWAVINNLETGDLMSLGMVLTLPTGAAAGVFPNGSVIPHSTLFQPWIGGIRVMGRGYLQNITNFILPTNGQDVFLFGSSFAAGYQLNTGRGAIPLVIPTFETHIRLPMNNRNPDGLIYLQDQVNLTSGVHFLWRRIAVSGAVNVPVVGPRPWNFEAIGNMNYRF